MFGRAIRNLLIDKCQLSQRRAFLTSKDSLYQQPLANDKEDISIYSPTPSINYMKVSIDKYVWADIDKWIHKTAIVSDRCYSIIDIFFYQLKF